MPKKEHPRMTKPSYSSYRKSLQVQGVYSFVDQFGKTFTACAECDNTECPIRDTKPGCMEGDTKPEILKIIAG